MGSALVSASLRRVGDAPVVRDDSGAAPRPAPVRETSEIGERLPEPQVALPPPHDAAWELPFQLSSLTFEGEIPIFRGGLYDAMTFFQREVQLEQEKEFITYPDPNRGTVRGYGVFRLLGRSERLIELEDDAELWDRVAKQHRLRQLPDAREIMTRPPHSYDPRIAGSGRNQVVAPDGVFRVPAQRDVTYEHAFQVMRSVCSPRQTIAWIESGIAPLRSRAVLHRYYLDEGLNIYLVRQTSTSRRLFTPHRCEQHEVTRLRRHMKGARG